jgi:hypothetical protein
MKYPTVGGFKTRTGRMTKAQEEAFYARMGGPTVAILRSGPPPDRVMRQPLADRSRKAKQEG